MWHVLKIWQLGATEMQIDHIYMAAQHTIEEIGMLFAGLMILFAAPLTAK